MDLRARPSDELYGLQILRGIAATGVVAHHVLRKSDTAIGRFSPDWLTTATASGVDIFFVLSGFIMLYVTFRPETEPTTPGTFLLRRFIRIFPLYWFTCILLLTLSAVHVFKDRIVGTHDLLASLLLLPNDNPILFVAWTLSFEIYFYVIFSAVLIFRSQLICVLGTTAIIVAMIVLSADLPPGHVARFLGSRLPLEFCLGLGLAYIFLNSNLRWPRSRTLVAVGVGLLAVTPLLVPHRTTGLPASARVIFWGLPALFIVAACLPVRAPRGAFRRFLVMTGDASYAIYLTHIFVIIAYSKLLQIHALARVSQILLVPVVIALGVGLGLITHRIVERPLTRWVKHLLRWIGSLVPAQAASGQANR